MVFSLSACGKKDKEASKPKYSLTMEEAIADPEMVEYESSIFVIHLDAEVDSVTVYHKDNVIYGLDQNSVAEVGDRSDSEVESIIEGVESKYSPLAEKGFVKLKVFVSEKSDSFVMNMQARKLDKKENLQMLADLGIFGELSADSTYKELEEILIKMNFEKQ